MRHYAGLISYCIIWFCCASVLQAQDQSDGSPLPFAVGNSAGIRSFKAGKWGVVGVDIANPRDHAVEIHATFFFDGVEQVQFGRRMWVPPHARRIAHCPVIPGGDRYKTAFEISNKLYQVLPNGDLEIMRDIGGELQRSMLLSKNPDRLVSATFPPMPYEEQSTTSLPTAYDALLATRLSAGLTRRVSEIARPNFPDQLHHLDAVDHLVISNQAPFSDAATTATIRQWVQRGGRLWIMLEQVPFDEVAAMLGESFHCSLVDEVELTDFTIVGTGERPQNSEALSFERPVKMVRVDCEDMDVLYTVDDWPAAFMQTLGLGRVLYTTISAPAWVRKPVYRSGDAPIDPERQAEWVCGPELQELAGLMLDGRRGDFTSDTGLDRYVAERVGYRIVPRRPVLLILMSYVAALCVGGVLLLRRHSAGKLVWMAPVMIIVAAAPLAVMAYVTKQRVPRTAASIQVVQVSPSTREAHVDGRMALFLQSPELIALSGQGSEAFVTENWGREDAIRELLWTDYDQWSWSNLRMTGGLKMADLDKSLRLPRPMRATMTFGPSGITGQIEGNWGSRIADAQIHVTSRRGLALNVDGDQFTADQNDLLAKDQYVAGALLSDEQRRRQRLIRALTREQPDWLYATEPTLLYWTDPLPIQVKPPPGVDQAGSALVRLPIEITRPPDGTKMMIPSTFLPFRSVDGPSGRGAASTYHTGRGEWVNMSVSSETWLRVQVPPEVLPAQLEKLRVRLQIDAPNRPLDIAGTRDGEAVLLQHRDSPSGVIEYEITDADLLELDGKGGLLVGIIVGEPAREMARNPEWRIHDLQLTAFASR